MNMNKKKKGILLSNLGSPDSTDREDVKKYLDQFLMDPYVIDLPYPLRAIIVKGIILRTRPAKSAEAYKIIWTPEGSPLIVFTRNLTHKVQEILGPDYSVKFAMRYGNPSFKDTLDEFLKEGVSEVALLPLYPHWALASIGSTLAHVKELNHECKVKDVLNPFHSDDAFIELFYQRTLEAIENNKGSGEFAPHYVFSFHGIPERHIKKSPGCAGCPIDEHCCLKPDAPKFCYRSHCYRTAHLIAKKLNLKPDEFTICFQSRLGLDKWLQPPTDVILQELPKKGVKRMVVLSPAFTADCLETIEELGERGREDFEAAGGKEYVLVPSLNDRDDWAQVLAKWVKSPEHFYAMS